MSLNITEIDLHLPHIKRYVRESGRDLSIFDLEATTFGGPTFGITECATLTIGGGGGHPILRSSLVNPENPISWQAAEKTGITYKMVKDKPNWGDLWANQMIELSTSGVLCGWNSKTFDVPRMQGEMQRYDFPELHLHDHIDVYKIASRLRGTTKGNLTATALAMNLDWDADAHRASADVLMTARVLEALCEKYGVNEVFLSRKASVDVEIVKKIRIRTKIDDIDILRAAQTFAPYKPHVLAQYLSTDIETLERHISELINKGHQTDIFTCSIAQSWLVVALPEVIAKHGERKFLRDTMIDLKSHPLAKDGLTYVQIRIAINNYKYSCAGMTR